MAAVLFVLPLIGSVTVGDALAVLGTIAGFLLRPHPQTPTFKNMTSAWGKPWPQVFNSGRISGQCIQAGDVTKHTNKLKKTSKFSQTFAMGICAGPHNIGRIWADNIVIYDPRPVTDPPPWQPDTQYGAGDPVVPTAGSPDRFFVATVDGLSGSVEPAWNNAINAVTRDNEEVWNTQKEPKVRKVGLQYNFTMRIYEGGETQLPDSALEELVGVGNQSAYRGLTYIVFENFNLSKNGNRIPNIEAEVLEFNTPTPFSFESQGHVYDSFNDIYSDPSGNTGFAWTGRDPLLPANMQTVSVSKISLTSNEILQTGPPFLVQTYAGANRASVAPFGSWTGTDLWWTGTSTVTGRGVFSVDKTTLAINHVWPSALQGPSGIVTPIALNRDGTIGAGIYYTGTFPTGQQWLWLMNLTDGTESVIDISLIGGPANEGAGLLWTPTFDDSGHLWMYDDHGKFWRVTITAASPPVASAAVSFVGRANDGALFGPLSFNPDTSIMTAWSENNSSSDAWAVPINTLTNVVGTIYNVIDGGGAAFGGSAEMFGWHNTRYVAIVGQPPLSNVIGRFDMLTGTTVLYDYPATWNETAPPTPTGADMKLTSLAVSRSGNSLVGTQWYSPAPGNNFWFFPLVANSITLADICAKISDQVGLAGKYDYSALASVIPRGVTLTDRMPARQFLESIMPAYFFDITESGALLLGSLRSESSLLLTIPESDLAASPTAQITDRLSTERNDDLEIPRDLSVSYYDYQHDYQPGSTPGTRDPITNYSSGRNTITVPCIMTPQEAINVATRLLYLAWIERNGQKFSTLLQYLEITSADVISVVRGGQQHILRCTRVTLNPTMDIAIEGVSEDFGVYELTVAATIADLATGSFVPGALNPVITPVLAILDTATLRQQDLQNPGVYAGGAASAPDGGWDGEAVSESQDDSVFDQKGTIGTESVMGSINTTLGNCARWATWDRVNTLDVAMLFGQMANDTEANLVSNFTNLIWTSNGEILQFATATLISGSGTAANPYVFRLSDLLRGRLGTEAFIATHAPGETFVFLDVNTVIDIDYSPSELDATRYWQGQNDAAINPVTPTQTLIMTTRRLMPYAPCYFRSSRDNPGNLTVQGKRRMRWRGTPLWRPPETDLPVTVEMDIYNGLSVVRTLTSTLSGGGSGITDESGFTAYYAVADQIADFGSPQASVVTKSYSINAVRGRGYPGSATV